MKVSPEFLPVIEWWEKDGKQLVTYVAIAAVLVGGYYGWKNYRAAQRTAASQALTQANSAEELEDAVSKYSGTPTAGALKIRLAKKYFDAERFEEALAVYEGLVGKAPEGYEDVPVVGRAKCLEALGRYAEAAQAFEAFAEANPKSYLALTAKLGAALSTAEAGDKAKALAAVAALKDANKDDSAATAAIDETEDCIRRYEKRAEKSLFDAADAAAEKLAPPAGQK